MYLNQLSPSYSERASRSHYTVVTKNRSAVSSNGPGPSSVSKLSISSLDAGYRHRLYIRGRDSPPPHLGRTVLRSAVSGRRYPGLDEFRWEA